jgi:hypothetical protein
VGDQHQEIADIGSRFKSFFNSWRMMATPAGMIKNYPEV